jgi:hypothetical protein
MLVPLIRRIGRHLRLIRYYSAPRSATRLRRFSDAAMLVSFVAAWLVAAWADRSFVSGHERQVLTGWICRQDDLTLRSGLSEDGKLVPPSGCALHGRFRITLDERQRGWPFASSVCLEPARPVVELLDPAGSITMGLDAERSALWPSIDEALAESGRGADAWRLRAGAVASVSRRPMAVAANGIVLSVLLPIGVWVVLAPLHLAGLLARLRLDARRADRRLRGRCEACGYDLRGSLRSARCPECGAPA